MSNHSHFPVDHDAESHANREREPKPPGFWSSRTGLVTIAFLAIGAFFLVSEHRAHVIPWLPWLILLACPLLHVFMHGGHGGHGGHGDADSNSSDGRKNPPHQH
jgi:hypothetical protein